VIPADHERAALATMPPFRSPGESSAPTALDAALGRALTHGLDLPLSALRASLESLAHALTQRGGAPEHLAGMLDEVAHIGRNVQDLVDYATPPRPQPLRCRLQEVVDSALRGLAPAQRACVLFARPAESLELEVDGPLLARALRRLLENSFEAGSDGVLLAARRSGAELTFGIVDGSPRPFDPEQALAPFHTTKPHHLGLGLTLVDRDAQLLGGALRFLRGPLGDTCAELRVPLIAEVRP
jgi:signal transduction histidine kinase